MSERNGIEIDYCPECRGIWLDRGELDKLLEKSQATQPPIAKSYQQADYFKYKKKKSFLEEIFD
jgi:Zn-finger nucleic acid-binding protein